MRLTVNGESAQQVWFHEKPLWQVEPEPWWKDEPGLMALYPLCQHGVKPDESILYAASRIEDNEKDRAIRADLLTSLGIFGRLAYPGLDALSLIGREKMKESLAYQEILQEGREEGREEGEMNATRVHILAVIADRFGKRAANAFRSSLNAIQDPKRLDRLFQTALRCTQLNELRKSAGVSG